MSFFLPFVQHHVSQLEVSVHNVFLHVQKKEKRGKKRFGQIMLGDPWYQNNRFVFESGTSMGDE